jgi:hypothetical protein
MGGNGVGLDSGGASFGGLGMRAIFSPFVWCTISPMRSPGQEVASADARSVMPVERPFTRLIHGACAR